MKNILLRILEVVASPFVLLAALILAQARKRGIQRLPLSKKILMMVGVFPVLDHFYEPLFNPKHLHKPLSDERNLPGIDFNDREQLEILAGFHYAGELLEFPLEKTAAGGYYYHNHSFEAGDAEYLYSMVRRYKPARIVEIGSGNSTLMVLNALTKNRSEDPAYRCGHTCIEPFENEWNRGLEKLAVRVVREKVEGVDRDIFEGLRPGDMLFIDSSHIIRPQGDVLYEYQEILPVLAPGVFVHIHDIFTPRDYGEDYLVKPVWFWNEQYLLEAFLAFNTAYRITGALNYLKHRHFEALAEKCPILKAEPRTEPASMWIARK